MLYGRLNRTAEYRMLDNVIERIKSDAFLGFVILIFGTIAYFGAQTEEGFSFSEFMRIFIGAP